MRRIVLVLALVLAGCGGGAATPSIAPVLTPVTSEAPIAYASMPPDPTPAPTPDPTSIRAVVAALDELQALVNGGADGDATGQWAIDAADLLGATGKLDPRLISFADNLATLLTAVADGSDQTDAIRTLLAQRAVLADLIGGVPTPGPTVAATTPEPVKPIVVKGKGRVNTKPFDVAAGDYTVKITGNGQGNVIAALWLRDKSDWIPIFNELPSGKYKYETIIYAVAAGSYYLDMEVDGPWTISLTPFR